ncbi:hypothetical protein HDK64DRAFT_1628 [Phyllosticta capitalensis]
MLYGSELVFGLSHALFAPVSLRWTVVKTLVRLTGGVVAFSTLLFARVPFLGLDPCIRCSRSRSIV